MKRTEAKLNMTSEQTVLASCVILWSRNEGREECKTWKRKAPVLTSLVCLGYTDVFVELFGGRALVFAAETRPL